MSFNSSNSSSSASSHTESIATTTVTTPERSQSPRVPDDNGISDAVKQAPSAAHISTKLSDLKDASQTTTPSAPFLPPGAEEGHPIDPLLRIYDPTKDDHLTIEEQLARPRLPRAPSERVAAAARLRAATKAEEEAVREDAGVSEEEKTTTTTMLVAADRENHITYIKSLRDELNAKYEKKH